MRDKVMGDAAIATEPASGRTIFGISRLAREFGLDRRTVVKRLEGVAPSGKDPHDYDGWTLDVAAPALLEVGKTTAEPKVRAYDQDKFYAAQLKRLEYEREVKQLVPASDVLNRWREVIKRLIGWVDSLADQLERAADLTPRQVEQIEKRLDEMRGDLHAELTQKHGANPGSA